MKSRRTRGTPPAEVPALSSSAGQRPALMMELLGRGAHASPRHGCSLLEYASVLAGERWGSPPRSVHPALAEVADMVNDQMTDDRRRLLTPLAPWLHGTNAAGPLAWSAITEVCVRAAPARARRPDEHRLLAHLDATRSWLQRRRARHAIRSALLSVTASADQDAADADAALCRILVDCVNECRRLAGEPAVDPRLPLADCPQRLAVEPHWTRSPGCDWMELGYRPAGARCQRGADAAQAPP